MTTPSVTIYTDGACVPNPGQGGWAALLIAEDGKITELSGADPDTTNNRMELTAAVEALRALKERCRVRLFTDSRYLRNGITAWLDNWIARGWRTVEGPVKNRDLWEALHAETRRHKVTWEWVRGHAGNRYNERVDELANAAREGLSRPASLSASPPAASAFYEVVLRVAAAQSRKGGGYAVRITDPNTGFALTRTGHANTLSSPRLELLAVVDALRHTPPGAVVRVFCQDEYLYKGATYWLPHWQKNNWMTSSGTPVKHQDLWNALIDEAGKRSVRWEPERSPHPLALDLQQVAADAANSPQP